MYLKIVFLCLLLFYGCQQSIYPESSLGENYQIVFVNDTWYEVEFYSGHNWYGIVCGFDSMLGDSIPCFFDTKEEALKAIEYLKKYQTHKTKERFY